MLDICGRFPSRLTTICGETGLCGSYKSPTCHGICSDWCSHSKNPLHFAIKEPLFEIWLTGNSSANIYFGFVGLHRSPDCVYLCLSVSASNKRNKRIQLCDPLQKTQQSVDVQCLGKVRKEVPFGIPIWRWTTYLRSRG